MKTVFVGGSRQVTRLPAPARDRLSVIAEQRHRVVVGDANGADKAVQRHFADTGYREVTVFCSGDRPRNNVGDWPVSSVVPGAARGFHFYAAKDREMAQQADAGLMIWDGKSPGTLLNVLRLAQHGKKAVLVRGAGGATTIRSEADWRALFDGLDAAVRDGIRERATAAEWRFADAGELPLDAPEDRAADARLIADLNEAFRAGDVAAVMAALRTSGICAPESEGEAPSFSDVVARLVAAGLSLRAARR